MSQGKGWTPSSGIGGSSKKKVGQYLWECIAVSLSLLETSGGLQGGCLAWAFIGAGWMRLMRASTAREGEVELPVTSGLK